ncbi:uncharacterized protein IWZ02DRAFT_436566 [Phyllosticta citriasiana]|uniref:Rap-GAP domain-containing protein n=1 Tax=Phyllosticta citriasiana TaxID=595635 RepID=A0ABR1L1V4_9PEZI
MSSPSPPPEALPQPPKSPETPMRNQASASSISNLFKDLIGRNRQSTTDVPSSVTSGAPVQGIFARRPSVSFLPRHLEPSSADGTEPTPGRHVIRSRPSHFDASGITIPPVMGGPPELSQYVEELSPKAPLLQRIDAAHRLCPILDQYAIMGVWGIWILAQESLLRSENSDAAQAACRLLYSLVKLPTLSSAERSNFFSLIATSEHEQIAGMRLQLLSSLTSGGRNIDALETKVTPVLCRLLDKCFAVARTARDSQRNAKADVALPEDVQLEEVFRLLIDLVKFNAKLLSDRHIEDLLEKVLFISRRTTRKPDLKNGIVVIDTLITYKDIPRKHLQPCLELLCSVCNRLLQLGDLRDLAERVIINLYGSHVAPAAVFDFLNILYGKLSSPKQRTNVVRGAVKVLDDLLFSERAEHLAELQLSLFLPALSELITDEYGHRQGNEFKTEDERVLLKMKTDNLHLDADVLIIIWKLLTAGDENKYKRQVFDEYDWTIFLEIILKCSFEIPDHDVRDFDDLGNHGFPQSVDSEESENLHPSVPLRGILLRLYEIRDQLDIFQRLETMALLVRLGGKLPDDVAKGVIDFHREERLLQPPNPSWKDTWEHLLGPFFRDKQRSSSLRIYSMRAIVEAYDYVAAVLPSEVQVECAKLVIDHINEETHPAVLEVLTDAAVKMISEGSEELVEYSMDIFQVYLWEFLGSLPEKSKDDWILAENPMSLSNVLTKALVRIFIRNFRISVWKTNKAYQLIIWAAGTDKCDIDARITAVKFLSRLRSDADYGLRISLAAEGESMAAVLCRTADTAAAAQKEEASAPAVEAVSPTSVEERAPSRDRGSVASGKGVTGVSTGPNSRVPSRVSSCMAKPRPVQPLWMYGTGQPGLPEDPPSSSSLVLFTHLEPSAALDDGDKDPENNQAESEPKPAPVPTTRAIFDIGLWIETVIKLFQNCTDWEVLSYLLVHIGPQLCNHTAWTKSVPAIKMLRNVLCEQIRNNSVPEPPSYTSLKRADVAVCYFHILTILLSYHKNFEKSEQDELVKSFLLGMGTWERTSKWCIHALTVCCHEIPESTTKHLQNFVQRMSQIITQPQIAIHILEFLTHLVRLPDLYVNFRDDEFKMVFGVCFRYLDYVRDQAEKGQLASVRLSGSALRHSGPSRDLRDSKPLEQQNSRKRDHGNGPDHKVPVDDLSQYVHALAYHVITFWFMAMKLEDRKQFVPWIVRRLVHTDRYGRETLEEQAQITIDMLHSRAHTDRDETKYMENFSSEADGPVSKMSWVIGKEMLLTFETAARTGVTQMIKRRPSYTSYGIYRPSLAPTPMHQVPLLTGLAAEAFYTSSYVGVLPEDIFQGFFAPITLLDPNAGEKNPWIQLPDDAATQRSIAALDRSPTVDGHKVGVIFIGEGQKTEQEVLANVMGTGDYTSFVLALGENKAIRLKDAKFNTQGLDTSMDMDGEFAICWRDRAVEIVFHVLTLMPTNLEMDPLCINKKRHIGNDFINIVFNNSGNAFHFDMFPSQFNYVYIVITPESHPTLIPPPQSEPVDQLVDPNQHYSHHHRQHLDAYYKVQVLTRPGFPEISPASETKIISGRGLPAYVRMLALNASVFCQVWSAREAGEYVSPWRNRLREIRRLWDKHAPPPAMATATPTPPVTGPSAAGAGSAGGGGLAAPGPPFGQRQSFASVGSTSE